MAYKISGDLEAPARILLINESDYSIEENTVFSGTTYEFSNVMNTTKTVLARRESDSQMLGFGNISPVYYSTGNTNLLLHFDEASFVDSSSQEHSISMYGNVTRTAAQSKFGGYSAYFDGNGDYISASSSSDWNFGSDNFTLEGFFYFTDGLTDGTVYRLISHGLIDTTIGGWSFGVGELSAYWGELGHKFIFDFNYNNVKYDLVTESFTTYANVWNHFAVVRNGNDLIFFLNGNIVDTKSLTYDITMVSPSTLDIGCRSYTSGLIEFFKGYADEIRISKGQARWTSNFTPPVGPYFI